PRAIGERSEDETVSYIAIDSIDNQDGLVLPETLRCGDLPSRARYEVRAGDILLSNVRPNRGAVTLVTARHDQSIASSGFTLLTAVDVGNSEYLFAFLKTPWATNQLIRRNRGSMYPAVVSSDVLDLVVLPTTDPIRESVTA